MTVQSFATTGQANDPRLRLDEIQGDVLVGLQKDAECFLFFTITDAPAFKAALRNAVAFQITSTSDVLRRESQIAAAKAAGVQTRFHFLGLNLGFTYRGLEVLLQQQDFGGALPGFDAAFRAGAKERGAALGDDPAAWRAPFAEGAVDGVLLITGPSKDTVEAHTASILAMFKDSLQEVCREMGAVRPQRAHEHFGFLDGISQPGIRGLTARENPLNPEHGIPGQELIWPGEFVFGYPGQVEPSDERPTTKREEGPVVVPPARWMKDGSLMVWRRLEQRVLAFREMVKNEAARLGMDSGLLAARMVGRWPSGAPLLLAPMQDDPLLGADKMRSNDFDFGPDPHQRRCPYAAHIRKTYPRDDLNDAGPPALAGESGEASVQTRRIRRAGIPFGPEIAADEKIGAEQSRGLMFVCYQTSIVEQFEFIQQSWSNNPGFVFGKVRPTGGNVTPGHDPIIGQVNGQRQMDEPVPNYPTGNVRSQAELNEQFVHATAGSYFFMPSVSALRHGPLVSDVAMVQADTEMAESTD
ncbi:Dyp-type peroxidase [Roseomonas xinghualingensis]|uniref:Dyp-type peroxidase n=1 Tax=Roseomonas xinghualingensis TaxID=2986475 RepID=UPI0021F15E5F|nr:Dyp-type peroxidase [Roseomonas sp. SXEYE001]MCV4209325.1 Dyp-type peroxidase [Roseomonas sp. SXEYE001]